MKKLLLAIVLLFISTIADAATKYIREGASGSGTGADWTNAYTSVPSSLTRGDTYYIADGSYGAKTFGDSGTSLITIKKATASDHGTSTGWDNSYGDGQAVFTAWTFSASYYYIDGWNGTAIGIPGSWTSTQGIAVRNLSSHLLVFSGAVTNLTFRHVEVDGTSYASADRDAVYSISGSTDVTFQYCYVHEIGCDIFQYRGNHTRFTVEYSKVARNNQDAACHGDVFEYDSGTALNWVVRYNSFEDTCGTYLLGSHESGLMDGLQFYGNVVVATAATSGARGIYTNGLISALSGGGTISNLKFYNNSIVGQKSGNSGFGTLRGTNNLVYNNIYHLSGAACAMGGTHDYNWFYNAGSQSETNIQNGTGSPFVSISGLDFNLTANTNPGANLGSPYNQDASGDTRTTWSRGALEYGEGVGDTTAPVVTTKTIAANGTTLTLAFNEAVSIGAGGNGGWTISPSGGAATLTYSSGSGSSSLVYTISRAIQYNETATVSYTQPTDGVEDTAGNDLENIIASSATNSSTQGQDTTPASFTFTDITGATLSTQYTALVQITEINTGITCTGSGGTVAACTGATEGTCGTFGSTSGTITNNQYVAARVTSSASYSTAVDDLVTCGGVSDTYTVTTLADPGGVVPPEHSTSDARGVVLRGVRK